MLAIGSGFFCFKQKTAYELRISDWSSDVCSSDLAPLVGGIGGHPRVARAGTLAVAAASLAAIVAVFGAIAPRAVRHLADLLEKVPQSPRTAAGHAGVIFVAHTAFIGAAGAINRGCARKWLRSEEHTSELQSLMRISYAVFCL